MFLEKLDILDFKNYHQQDLNCNHKVNLFYGDNGSGKTNILDAIYYLCISKSYFSMSDREVLRDKAEGFRLSASIRIGEEDTDRIVIKFRDRHRKEIERNGIKLKSSSEIIGLYPVVFIAPDDIRIVKDDSRHRRSLIDRMLSQSDRNYLGWLIEYNRALKQKTAHLKKSHNIDALLIKSINEILKKYGAQIYARRKEFTAYFAPRVQEAYGGLTDNREAVTLVYESQFNDRSLDYYDRILDEEVRARRALIGIHKDDFVFSIDQKMLKRFGSQGQIKSFLYALRLSEFDYLRKETGRTPILLLDDLFEKLDHGRLENLLLQLKNDTFEQVFVSDTELERSRKILSEHNIPFSAHLIRDGRVQKTTHY